MILIFIKHIQSKSNSREWYVICSGKLFVVQFRSKYNTTSSTWNYAWNFANDRWTFLGTSLTRSQNVCTLPKKITRSTMTGVFVACFVCFCFDFLLVCLFVCFYLGLSVLIFGFTGSTRCWIGNAPFERKTRDIVGTKTSETTADIVTYTKEC